jgi:hypothetical protein
VLDDLKIYKESYDFFLWLWPLINKFPKSEKYVLGEKLKFCFLEFFDAIISYNYNYDRKESLKKANIELEKLRLFIRIARDLNIINFTKYEIASRKLNEIGKLLGGIIKTI